MEGFPWDDLHKIFIQRSWMATVPHGVEILEWLAYCVNGSERNALLWSYTTTVRLNGTFTFVCDFTLTDRCRLMVQTIMYWYVSELNAVQWHCFVDRFWKELIAVVVLNIVFFMVRQSLTQREFNSCQNTLNTCMLTSSQVNTEKCTSLQVKILIILDFLTSESIAEST